VPPSEDPFFGMPPEIKQMFAPLIAGCQKHSEEKKNYSADNKSLLFEASCYLSAKEISQASCVCREWRDTLQAEALANKLISMRFSS